MSDATAQTGPFVSEPSAEQDVASIEEAARQGLDIGSDMLGVIVPCRNEAAVIERKLHNLLRTDWPPHPGGPHRIVVVDDGSDDGTADIARRVARDLADDDARMPVVDVVANDQAPGKAGAIATGLALLGSDVQTIVLTDADVVFHAGSLPAVERAFATDPTLGMACGSQEFVADLSDDGQPLGADESPLVPAAGRYDRLTARVRAWESTRGRLFSVHGQLLAWRTDLGLRPTPGIAADDLDLMTQVRAQGRAVRKLADARFLEVKTPPGDGRRAQELRRARAYVQVARRFQMPRGRPLVDHLQFAAYRWLPLAAPCAALVTVTILTLTGLRWLPSTAGIALLSLLVLAALLPAARHAARLLYVIAVATVIEKSTSLGDRWEMERTNESARKTPGANAPSS